MAYETSLNIDGRNDSTKTSLRWFANEFDSESKVNFLSERWRISLTNVDAGPLSALRHGLWLRTFEGSC
ncbi:MAG: hypothetical protein Fues2KO_54280 [Fuerstiella sp.]